MYEQIRLTVLSSCAKETGSYTMTGKIKKAKNKKNKKIKYGTKTDSDTCHIYSVVTSDARSGCVLGLSRTIKAAYQITASGVWPAIRPRRPPLHVK